MNTKHSLKAATAFLFAAILSFGFAACSNDDEDNDKNTPESEPVTTYDDLAFFQDTFIETDTLGNFIARSAGEPIYDNDTLHIYIGVDNIEEALTFWDDCLAPDIQRIVSAAHNYTYTLTDEEGHSQGTVSFVPGTESGHVAEITTNAAGLKHFKQITFLLNSAWPYNSETGKYLVGEVRYEQVKVDGNIIHGNFNDKIGFVCVREKANGVKPLYVALTVDSYSAYTNKTLLTSKYCPGEGKAKMIYNLLQSDWDFFVACFEDAGEGQLEDTYYWYDKRKNYIVAAFQYAINLSNGKIDRWDYAWHSPSKRAILKIDWEDE